MANRFKTTCSGCSTTVTVDTGKMTALVQVPSNGKRGAGHRPGYTASVDLFDIDDTLVGWDCPICEYADSAYNSAALRRELA